MREWIKTQYQKFSGQHNTYYKPNDKEYHKNYREKNREKLRKKHREYMRLKREEERRIYWLFIRNPERDIKEDFDKWDLKYIKKINEGQNKT